MSSLAPTSSTSTFSPRTTSSAPLADYKDSGDRSITSIVGFIACAVLVIAALTLCCWLPRCWRKRQDRLLTSSTRRRDEEAARDMREVRNGDIDRLNARRRAERESAPSPETIGSFALGGRDDEGEVLPAYEAPKRPSNVVTREEARLSEGPTPPSYAVANERLERSSTTS